MTTTPLPQLPTDTQGPSDYFQKARRWEDDVEALRQRSERRAWTVAISASLLALVSVTGLAFLAPLRRAVPYVFEVDKTTGLVQFVAAADDQTVKGYGELLDKHWVQRYVLVREAYYYPLLQSDYDTTLSLSAGDVAKQYGALYEGPDSRDRVLGAQNEERIDILSITLIPDKVSQKASVRFIRTTRSLSHTTGEVRQAFLATLAYRYEPSAFGQEKDLIRNPLGFKVTAYRVDPEITDEDRAVPLSEGRP